MYKVVYKQGSFVDYKGTNINFILAAVSIPTNYVIVPVDDLGFETEEDQLECYKILSIGISVQHAEDAWNEELGKKIAYGRALKKRDHVIATTDVGIINTKMVEATIEQEAEYMKVNPGRYISGYDDARDRYLEMKAKEEYLNSLTPEELSALKVVASLKDPQKFNIAVEEYRNKHLTINSNTAKPSINS